MRNSDKNAKPKATPWNFDKVFYPTLDLYLLNGKNAITDFRDKARADEAEQRNRHAVIITHQDIDELTRQSKDYKFAEEALSFIQEHTKHVPGGQERPVDLGDNLFLVVTPERRLEDVQRRHPELFTGNKPKLEVICLNAGEAIKYHEAGFKAEISQFDKVNASIRREGIKTITNTDLYGEMMQRIQSERAQHGKEHRTAFDLGLFRDEVTRIFPNQYFMIYTEEGGQPIVGYVRGAMEFNKERRLIMDEGGLQLHIMHAHELHSEELGIKPKDLHQAVYMHAMRQPHISRIFVTGGPASGKTLVGYASALAQTLPRFTGKGQPRAEHLEDDRGEHFDSRFRKVYVTKPLNELMGGSRRELGFKPGTERDKLWVQIQSYLDAHGELDLQASFEECMDGLPGAMRYKDLGHGLYLPPHGRLLEVQDYNQWLGRTINRSVIFADEAQNLDPYEFQGINTRTGHGCLVIFSGDYEGQVYNRTLSTIDNGLFQGLQFYMGRPYTAVIHLEKAYRDQAAEDAISMHVQRRPDRR